MVIDGSRVIVVPFNQVPFVHVPSTGTLFDPGQAISIDHRGDNWCRYASSMTTVLTIVLIKTTVMEVHCHYIQFAFIVQDFAMSGMLY